MEQFQERGMHETGASAVLTLQENTMNITNYLGILELFLQSCKWHTFNQMISFNKMVPLHSGGLTLRVGLNKTFPNRWIGQDGCISWPPPSAGITLLDFFFCGYVKVQVFHPKVGSVVELLA
jgi:hypothetical protein